MLIFTSTCSSSWLQTQSEKSWSCDLSCCWVDCGGGLDVEGGTLRVVWPLWSAAIARFSKNFSNSPLDTPSLTADWSCMSQDSHLSISFCTELFTGGIPAVTCNLESRAPARPSTAPG